MRAILVPCVTVIGLATACSPARASSVPPFELAPGQTAVEAGLFDLNVDLATAKGAILGVEASILQNTLGMRATYRLDDHTSDFGWGVTVAAGMSGESAYEFVDWLRGKQPASDPEAYGGSRPYVGPSPDWFWVSPALVGRWALHAPWTKITLRGSVGPNLRVQADSRWDGLIYYFVVGLVPSIEVALGGEGNWPELVMGGNGLIGLRARF